MQVSDEHVAAVRAYLRGDEDAERRLDRLAPRDAYPFAALITAAFLEAIQRRFGESWTRAEVVRLVASIRSRIPEHAHEVDAGRAETLIRATLGDGDPASLDDETKALQAQLLLSLIEDERLNDDALDTFLAAARTRAERIPSS